MPSLRPGQVVILDQLNVHKRAAMRAVIEAAGCRLLLLPSYSPDFNPIEQAFAKIKTHLRTADGRTFPALVTAIGAALDTITPADAVAASPTVATTFLLNSYETALGLDGIACTD